MILVDKNKSPERTVFYLAAVLNHLLHEESKISYNDLCQRTINFIPYRVSLNQEFILALDFLFLIGAIDVDDRGLINALT